jgi:hypothetical protein
MEVVPLLSFLHPGCQVEAFAVELLEVVFCFQLAALKSLGSTDCADVSLPSALALLASLQRVAQGRGELPFALQIELSESTRRAA